MTAPTLVYDGDCGFCAWSAGIGARVLPAAVTVVPFQSADLAGLGVSRSAAERAVQWVGSGPPVTGHRAIARWLIASGRPWSFIGRLLLIPPVSWIAAGCYRVVAANRHRIPGPWRAAGASCPTR